MLIKEKENKTMLRKKETIAIIRMQQQSQKAEDKWLLLLDFSNH